VLAWTISITWNVTPRKVKRQRARKQLPYPQYVKDTYPNFHVWVFKATIWANSETKDENIVNMFIFNLHDIISKWSQKFLAKHSNYIFCKVGINIL
jgi:hypothetical protein